MNYELTSTLMCEMTSSSICKIPNGRYAVLDLLFNWLIEDPPPKVSRVTKIEQSQALKGSLQKKLDILWQPAKGWVGSKLRDNLKKKSKIQDFVPFPPSSK